MNGATLPPKWRSAALLAGVAPEAMSEMAAREDREQGRKLLEWFDAQQRDLPWRKSRDPYPVWVSEVMLQQTRVEAARPYFDRFLETFPSVEALAAASEESVLSLWSGLGYYQRARRLHAAARQIVANKGEFPTTTEGWLQLPGVGRYTAAAVASIVFGAQEPAIDGNVMRVVARLLVLEEDPKKNAGFQAIETKARDLLDSERPGDSNQAIMEIGATICRPRKPLCSTCPLEEGCLATATGEPERYPVAGRKAPVLRHHRRLAVVEDGDRLLLFRRPPDSKRLAGLWEFPWIEGCSEGDSDAAFANRYGGSWEVGPQKGRVTHSVTNRSFRIDVVQASLNADEAVAEGPEAGWFCRSALAAVPVTGLVGKVLGVLDA